MEGSGSLLDTLFDEENENIGADIEMFDAEEGELIEPKTEDGETRCGGDIKEETTAGKKSDRNKKKKKKKKNKNKRGGATTDSNVTNINRFVSDACKHLRERKSYLLWTAVGCLGVPALSDLLKEVDAIRSCGGQKTADGSRYRNGGGILWNLIKARDPEIYKQIMRRGREFEKQFRQRGNSSRKPEMQEETTKAASVDDEKQKRRSVHDRIRAPVSYDDL
ncbi:hypothetical protein M569_12875, partial [Genlisea aurea]